MSTSAALREIFAAGRPLVEEWLDIAEQIAALRDAATEKGLDWSQLKALMKAQIQDERDGTGEGKRVRRIVEKAEFASAYAGMLGLANMNENNFSPYSLPSPSTEAKQAGEGEPLQPSPATPVPSVLRSPVVVGGRPYPSSDEAPAGQQGMFGQSEHQTTDLPWIGNEPEVGKAVSATPSAMTAKTQAELIRLLRPNCRHADDLEKCGGQGSKHCHACTSAAREVAI